MRTITIFYDQSGYIYRWLKPLMASRKEFKQLGYKVEYSSIKDYIPRIKHDSIISAEKEGIRRACKGEYDIVFLAYHHSTSYLGQCSEKERAQILVDMKKHCNMLVWLDTADSTGTCLFDVLPYVDLYFKKQLLKDLDLYTKPVWGARIYCDYYHNRLGIEDEQVTNRIYPILDKKYAYKLRISWNVGIGDLMASQKQVWLHPFSRKTPKFISPNSQDKNLDLQYRGSSFSPIAGYQRQYCKEFVSKVNYITHSDPFTRVSHEDYVKEGENSHAILSPFGWGEVCGRDFEAYVYGATMIKMSMEHCITFPDAYQPYITYVPVKWDFSDLDEILHKISSKEYKDIAINAQNFYKHCFLEAFKLEFANHVIKELEKK